MSKQIWLLDLPECCRAAGLTVTLYDGWETRSRSSGGYDDLLGVGYHHDASSSTSDDGSSDAYGWLYADDKPIGAMRLHRDGRLVIGAAGATNTMGKGGPLVCSKGNVPQDRGNQTLIAIEAANNGVGEPWPKVQVDAYIALVGGLCWWYDLDPQRDIVSHWEYCKPSCPGRKIDPAGPTPSAPSIGGSSGSSTWSTPGFRDAVGAWPPPDTPNPDPPPPILEYDDMLFICKVGQDVYVGDGVRANLVDDDDLDTLKANLEGNGTARWRHPARSGLPILIRMADIPVINAGQRDTLVGWVET
jgi:hypothetical protein